MEFYGEFCACLSRVKATTLSIPEPAAHTAAFPLLLPTRPALLQQLTVFPPNDLQLCVSGQV